MKQKVQSKLLDKTTTIFNKKSRLKGVFNPKKEVTVIIPTFNSKEVIERCVESLIDQSFSFNKIECIIIDDGSTDETGIILKKLAKRYSNLIVVVLDENTGNAAMPRNIGIELASTEKIMFLDSDDWLAPNAIKALVTKMDANNDDFVVGRTIRVNDNGESIHAEFASFKEYNHVPPLDVPYIYYHMGPPAKLMRTSIIKENEVYFPEMSFAEDKYFFFSVLSKCERMSVIQEPIYYVNRLTTNKESLTRKTEMLDKRKSDFWMLNSVLKSNYPVDIEKNIVVRIIEYDLIRSCNSLTFINSKEKDAYMDIVYESLRLVENRDYDILEEIEDSLYKKAAEFILDHKKEEFIRLFKWNKKASNKKVSIEDGVEVFEVMPITKDENKVLVPIDLHGYTTIDYVEEGFYVHEFAIFGKYKNSIEHVIIRDRNRTTNEIYVPVEIVGNIGKFKIKYEELNKLTDSLFTVFIRYNGHHLINIKRITNLKHSHEDRNFTFYSTKAGNLGFSLGGK